MKKQDLSASWLQILCIEMKGKIFISQLILFGFLLLGSVSCDDDDDSSPDPTASISGQVELFDEGTNEESASGMTVSMEGTILEDLTDGSGRFELSGVPLGSLVLLYEKSGYGTYKQFINDFNEDLVLTEVPSLGKLSQTDVITNSVTIDGTEVSISSVTTGTNTDKRYLRYFFSTSSNISFEDFDVFLESPVESDPGANPAVFVITAEELNNLGFNSGTTVYARVYGDSYYSNDYEDPDLGRRVFPNLFEDTAQSVQFEVP